MENPFKRWKSNLDAYDAVAKQWDMGGVLYDALGMAKEDLETKELLDRINNSSTFAPYIEVARRLSLIHFSFDDIATSHPSDNMRAIVDIDFGDQGNPSREEEGSILERLMKLREPHLLVTLVIGGMNESLEGGSLEPEDLELVAQAYRLSANLYRDSANVHRKWKSNLAISEQDGLQEYKLTKMADRLDKKSGISTKEFSLE